MTTSLTLPMLRVAHRLVLSAVISACVLFSAPPAPSLAVRQAYVSRPCIIKAMVGEGTKGGKCNLYGVGIWVDISKRGSLPNWAQNAVVNCLKGGVVGVVSAWYAKTPASAMVVLAVSCFSEAVAGSFTR